MLQITHWSVTLRKREEPGNVEATYSSLQKKYKVILCYETLGHCLLTCSLFQAESWNHIALISRGTQMSTEWFFLIKDEIQSLCVFIVGMSRVSHQSLIVNNIKDIKYKTYLFNSTSSNVLVRCWCICGLILMCLYHAPQFSFDCEEKIPPPVRALCPLIALIQERAAPISYHFSQEAVKSLFMGNLTPKAYCCHMLNNTSCK